MLTKAKTADFRRIADFYRYAVEHTENIRQYARWSYGNHPTDEMIQSYIERDTMYYWEENGLIVSAAALTLSQEENYHSVNWNARLNDDEVAVVHLLCVSPMKQRCGVGKAMMAELIGIAKSSRKKAVRLETLSSNLPACKLYESIGFIKCGTQNRYTDRVGWIEFGLYECIIP